LLKQYIQIKGLALFYQLKSYSMEHLVMPGETWSLPTALFLVITIAIHNKQMAFINELDSVCLQWSSVPKLD